MERKYVAGFAFLLFLSFALLFINCCASAENLLKNGSFQELNEDGMKLKESMIKIMGSET